MGNFILINSKPLSNTGQLSNIKKQYEDTVKITNEDKKLIQNKEKNIRIAQNQLKNESEFIKDLLNPNDYIRLNVGGQTLVTRRSTLTKIPNSKLARWFNLSSPNPLQMESDRSYFLDFNPTLFSYLLDQLRSLEDITKPVFKLPTSKSSSKAFRKMLIALELPVPPISKNDHIILSIGGKKIETLRETINKLSDSNLSKQILNAIDKQPGDSDAIFVDFDPDKFYRLLEQSRTQEQNEPVTKKSK